MGYDATYTLEWGNHGESADDELGLDAAEIAVFIRESGDASFVLNEDGTANNTGSWFSEEEDMRELSTQLPHLLFTVSYEGPEGGDLVKTYYLNGKMQQADAIITYPPFDESLLE